MITFTTEILFHFLCSACKLWWSVGDCTLEQNKQLVCPFCGHKAEPVPEWRKCSTLPSKNPD